MMARDKFPMGGAALLRGLDFGRRGSAALPLTATILFFAVGAMATTTNDLADAEIQGRKLAQQLCETRPAENFTNAGILKIKDRKGKISEVPIIFKVFIMEGNWKNIYLAPKINMNDTNAGFAALWVTHSGHNPNLYGTYKLNSESEFDSAFKYLVGEQIMTPFAGSDFWLADLGLEFFHWPDQKILKHEMRRGRACKVLESTNPSPSTNGYARVVSWIDNESGGIVQAEAYDFKNKLLKEFAPKSFKKMNGQWELQEMEIRNVQTGSRTRLEFDLKKE
jgi:hypothetical protein